MGNGSSDGDALVRLVSIEVPPGFDDTVRAATADEERTVRGNAVELVPHVLPADEALRVLTRAVRDEDAVVRRRPVAAGWAVAALHPHLLLDALSLLRAPHCPRRSPGGERCSRSGSPTRRSPT